VHGLTKVLVALAALLSVFLSALVIAYAVNTDRIQSEYNTAVSKELATAASNAQNMASIAKERTDFQAQISSAANDRQALESRLKDIELQRVNLLTEKAKAESARDSTIAKITELSETVKTMQTLIGSYREEVTQLRRAELASKQQKLEMEDRISDLESQRDVLTQNYRAVQEQLNEAKIAASAAAGGSAGTTAATTENQAIRWQGTPITGRVDAVEKDAATGGMLAKISVGTNNGVLKNMLFYVIRDGEFVNNIQVRQTDLKESVAKVVLANGKDVQVGDTIVTRILR
jgi:hypothetical protein